MKFKAAVLRQSGLPRPYATSRSLAIETVEAPPPAAGEVVVAVKAASFPIARLVAEARTIKGSYIGTCVPGRDIPAFIQLYRQGCMPVDKLVTRTLRLDDINDAFDALSDAREVRQVIAF